MFTQLTGKPCDATHPFPAPPESAWADSMEFGAPSRQPTTNENATLDVDTSATWRAIGAWIWEAPCQRDHMDEVASSAILTTHLLAVAMLSRKSAHPVEELAFNQVGAGAAINALLGMNGLEPAHDEVQKMSVSDRRQLVAECLALVLKGHTNLRLDLEGFYLRG